MSMKLGLKNLHIAFLDDSADTATATTYTDLQNIINVNAINVDATTAEAKYYADNGAKESDIVVTEMKVDITVADISPDLLAKILGMTIDANGGMQEVGNTAPYIALGFEQTFNTAGRSKFVWLYKGKLGFPKEEAKSQTDKIDYQDVKLSGTFIRRRSDNGLIYTADTTAKNYKSTLGDNWFTLGTINKVAPTQTQG